MPGERILVAGFRTQSFTLSIFNKGIRALASYYEAKLLLSLLRSLLSPIIQDYYLC